MTRKLIPLTDADAMRAAGLPFGSTDSARWDFRHADERGTSSAYVRIGKRVFIDPDRYHELVRAKSAA